LYRIKIYNPKKHILYLLPTFIMVIMYIYFIYLIINENILVYLFRIPQKPIGFDQWFPMMNGSIISNIIIIFDIFSWLIYWIFFNKIIRMHCKVILNIITPISIIFLYFAILLQFTH
jgi:hypothetical protein